MPEAVLTFTCARCGRSDTYEERVAAGSPVARGEVDYVCADCFTPAESAEKARVMDEAIGHVINIVYKPEQN